MFKLKPVFFVLPIYVICFLISVISSYASEESLTITTYYPSPYGSYRELRSQRIAIGDDYIQGKDYCWEGESGCGTGGQNMIPAATDLVVQGNVGIGTTGPGVVDNTDSNVLELGIGSHARPIFRITSASQSFVMGIDDVSPTKLQIQPTSGSNWLPRNSQAGITIDSAGNVGIGTASPSARLHVQRDTANNKSTNICVRVNYTSATGIRACPAGYYIAWGTTTAGALPDGYVICCQACQDGGPLGGFVAPDGICD